MGTVTKLNPLEELTLEQLQDRIEQRMEGGEYRTLWSEVKRREKIGVIIITDHYLDDWEDKE